MPTKVIKKCTSYLMKSEFNGWGFEFENCQNIGKIAYDYFGPLRMWVQKAPIATTLWLLSKK